MCGILCLISQDDKKSTSLGIENGEWKSSDRDVIRRMFQEKLTLTPTDANKLKYQSELRDLNDQLVKLRNNIKEDKAAEIRAINERIKQLIGAEREKEDNENDDAHQVFDKLIPEVTARGPDYVEYKLTHCVQHIHMYSSVLSLRQPFMAQPVENDRYILQFNGELYDPECEFSNDTAFFLHKLSDRSVDIIAELNGEFAFLLLDKEQKRVYFGRDKIGKRSLCYRHEEELIVSSNSFHGCIECESGIIYELDLENNILRSNIKDLKLLPALYSSNAIPQTTRIYDELLKSCFIRQETIHPLHQDEANIAVLFSGGLDCTILTAMLCENFMKMDKSINIDLLNVGFDNPRTGISAAKSPDRLLGIKSWFHLSKKYWSRNINLRFVEVDVTYEMWLLHRRKVEALMYPQVTEMDLSIAIAFYFASNNLYPTKKYELTDQTVNWGDFVLQKENFALTSNYISQAKVLFSGLGADELFGGYSRHEAVFADIKPNDDPRDRFEELNNMLVHDIRVIYTRNLGRDDRVVSHWGKELRYPFLDFSFVSVVTNEIEPNMKVKLEWIKTKKGNTVVRPVRKWLLRLVAEYMGLEFVQHELKRAIQFGAKSAKMEIGQSKTRGTDFLRL